ncbi:DUF3039 domain-containing protein [Naasia sp.]|jgi:hypothetical protein|uniref:DUF3039 domain-containing protein n=1 Tax=Naasia sp. TaxID=2546198 RepID=UPI002608BDCA|nr:DUF3039 domain-containing protein [Naasia sp.]
MPVDSSTEPGGGTSTLDRELEELLEREQVDEGDHDRFAHYVRKEKIVESAVTGKPVIALCGKVWVPGRDPSKFAVCPTCKEIYKSLAE